VSPVRLLLLAYGSLVSTPCTGNEYALVDILEGFFPIQFQIGYAKG
jgi:hypothetical protein